MPYDLFISYSRRDNEHGRITEFVKRISRDFEASAGRPRHKRNQSGSTKAKAARAEQAENATLMPEFSEGRSLGLILDIWNCVADDSPAKADPSAIRSIGTVNRVREDLTHTLSMSTPRIAQAPHRR